MPSSATSRPPVGSRSCAAVATTGATGSWRRHVLPPACDRVGELHVADIGIPTGVVVQGAQLFLLGREDVAAVLPPRAPASHKGSFGHVLVIAGSVGKTGAAALCAAAALRTGA